MEIQRAIDFLLENAGPVIQYRLHKEILKDLSPAEEENLLEQVMQTPYFRCVESYGKPNGYIGVGMHSPERFKRSRLDDGETAARLLSYYAIPKDTPLIKNFIAALRSDEIFEQEFRFYPPAYEQFQYRMDGLHNGTSLMVINYTLQALLGYGDDDYVKPFRNISLDAFRNILNVDSITDLAVFNPKLQKRFNTSYYLEEETSAPCAYHLATLAYTKSWCTPQNQEMLAEAINHLGKVNLMENVNGLPVKFHGKYGGSLWLLLYPLRPFDIYTIDGVMYRRILTEIAMLGVGTKVDIIQKSLQNLEEAMMMGDGIVHWEFTSPYQKQVFREKKWPTAYCDVWLEEDHKKKYAMDCELTFWAVQFLDILERS